MSVAVHPAAQHCRGWPCERRLTSSCDGCLQQAYSLGFAAPEDAPAFVHFITRPSVLPALDEAVTALASRPVEIAGRDIMVYGASVEALTAVAVRPVCWRFH